jgi:peptide/nickel transport system substrate-binding protein
MSKFKALVALALTAALLTGGVTASHAATKKVLTIGEIGDLVSFAASKAEAGNRVHFYQAPYDSLLAVTPDGTLKANLVTKWAYDASATKLTLTLRKGVKFTDGTSLDAAAVVKNLNAFQKGESPDASNLSAMTSAVAKGKTQVNITLKAADPAFLNYLARSAGFIESPKQIGTAAEKATPVGSGPYVLNKAKTKSGSVYTFDKNKNYWNKSVQKFDTVVLKVISDQTAMVNALKSGQVDAANLASNDVISELMASGLQFETNTLDWVGLSLVDRTGKLGSPLDNVKVRQAINYAFDRKALLKTIGSGYGSVVEQVFAPKSAGYDAKLNSTYTYDVAKAKSLMAEAGYAKGFTMDMPSLTAFLGEAPYTLISDQLAAIGIKVKYTEEPFSTFFGNILAPKYPAYLMFLEQSPNDWQFIQFLVSRTAVWNPDKYGDATSDALIAKIQVANDKSRPALLKQLNKYIVEQAWFVPFYVKQGTQAHSKSVKVKMQAGNAIPYLLSYAPTK